MHALHTQATLRAALRSLMASNVPPDHKAVLIDAVAQTLGERDGAHEHDESLLEPRAWEAQEIEQLRALLEGRTARCWQEADELLTRSARQLGRPPLEVRQQAAMLGLGQAVDYRRARTTVSER